MSEGTNLADWLQETARRDALRRQAAQPPAPMAVPIVVPGPAPRSSPAPRRIAAVAGLSLAYLQYYFVGVMTEIYSLPALVVFVPYTTFG